MFTICLGLIGLGWLLLTVRALVAVASLRSLPEIMTERPVRVSVILAARDEAARIETTIRGLLASVGVELELIAVDDRSADATGPVLDRLAESEPALQVIHVTELPPGWLGKCHALHVGARRATGDWLLFMDGDIWIAPQIIARAVAAAERERVAHLCLLPGIVNPALGTVLDRAALLCFLMGFVIALDDANRDLPWRALGVGAFNLVRPEAYRAIGGHAALRLEVVDDMKLGLLLRRAGRKTRGFLAATEVQCDWPHTLRGLCHALEKNAFALMGFRRSAVVGASLAAMAGTWMPLLGLLPPTPIGVFTMVACLSFALPCGLLARRHGGLLAGLLVPFVAAPVICAVMWNSMLATLRGGGVRWRDTFYSLEELRAGAVH